MRPGFLLSEVVTGLRRSVSMALSIVIVTTVSLFFLGTGLLAERQIEAAKGYWYDKVEVSIFLCTERSNEPNCNGKAVTPQQRQAVAALLDSMKPPVAEYYYESQDEAYARFKEQFKDNPSFADTPKAAIPEAYRVKLDDPGEYRLVYDAFTGAPGVAAVKDIREVLDPLFKALNLLTTIALSLAGVLLLCAVLLTSTTIRQVAWSRRREVTIKRIVGASKLTIGLPFAIEVLLSSLLGAGLAVLALWATVRYGVSELSARFQDFAWVGEIDVLLLSPWLFLVAAVVALVVSWAALSRYVRI
ncbi:permease-like cell division protein FtsX [Gephyromycinifex aptenodytis]|uniref:permease-like cell division protein FtsX n=1 Tax=Gephyromycinifex aptenodytis TaxID=2716227 RepID=UPI00144628B2|nr:permease-like cell division protein FtsX [Gephyromycinifex aptenodytis]